MTASITVTITDEDKAWLDQRGDDLALDAESVVRMLVRQARKGSPAVNTNGLDLDLARQRAAKEAEAKRHAEIEAKKAALRAQLAALDDKPEPYPTQRNAVRAAEDEAFLDEFEVPPDPDGGVATAEIGDLLARAGSMMSQVQAPRRGPPGTLTEPVGVNPRNAGSGYQQGDAAGNVTRQNFGHLGFNGGGSRG